MNKKYVNKWLFETKSMVTHRNKYTALKSISRMELRSLISQQGWRLEEVGDAFTVYKTDCRTILCQEMPRREDSSSQPAGRSAATFRETTCMNNTKLGIACIIAVAIFAPELLPILVIALLALILSRLLK